DASQKRWDRYASTKGRYPAPPLEVYFLRTSPALPAAGRTPRLREQRPLARGGLLVSVGGGEGAFQGSAQSLEIRQDGEFTVFARREHPPPFPQGVGTRQEDTEVANDEPIALHAELIAERQIDQDVVNERFDSRPEAEEWF